METKKTIKKFRKEFKCEFTPSGFYFPIDAEIDVDFIGIESQEELNQLIIDMKNYDYKIVSIISWNSDEDRWIDYTSEARKSIPADQIDCFISDTIDKEAAAYEQARKNG